MAAKSLPAHRPNMASAPIIRRNTATEESGRERILRRQVPAWIVSGLFHFLLIAAFILLDRTFKRNAPPNRNLSAATTNTRLEEPPPPSDDNLTVFEPALDADLPPAVADVWREADPNIVGPDIPEEAPGLPSDSQATPPIAMPIGSVSESNLAPGAGPISDLGNTRMGQRAFGMEQSVPGYDGRYSPATRDRMLKRGGGDRVTEEAVARGLVWLARQQQAAGYWEFDGTSKPDRVAATGLCLLPFFAAGETHLSGKKYQDKVAKGLKWLKEQLRPNGQFANGSEGVGMYSQAIATIALCEAAGMTQDKATARYAKLAVQFIVASQGDNGSWGYTAGTNGDTSIVGWNIQALKSARLAGLSVPDKAFRQAEAFLKSASSESEAAYGYRGPGATHTLSAVGLLCRQYMGWSPRNPSLARGVRVLVEKFPPQKTDWNMYYYYYASQVVHFFGGDDWLVKWNPAMRSVVLDMQVTDKSPNAKAADHGSWPRDNYFIGINCGKLGTTALAVLTLEVYYRHLPLYKRDAGGLQELER